MHAGKLDDMDLILLEHLQEEGRTTRSDLAKASGKSIPAVSERLRRLEEGGVIKGYYTHLAPRKIGLEVMAFVTLQIDSSKHYPAIIEEALAEPHVLECHAMTGIGSHLLKVQTQNTEQLEWLLAKIQSWPGVSNTRTNIVLSSPKSTSVLPLPPRSDESDSA